MSEEPKQIWRKTNFDVISKINHLQTGHIARLKKLKELTKHFNAFEKENQRQTKQYHGEIPPKKCHLLDLDKPKTSRI